MPRAKNRKKTSAPAQGSATPRDATQRDVPPGLASRPGKDIPAGLSRAGGDVPASLAGLTGNGTVPGISLNVPASPPATKSAAKRTSGSPAPVVGGPAPVRAKPAPADASPVTATAEPATDGADGGDDADDVPQWAAKALQQLLTVTYWLDPGDSGEPFGATIRFTGHRTDVTGQAQPGDTFSREETVEKILPGSGPVAITAEVRDINQGTWEVTGQPVPPAVRPEARNAPTGARTAPVGRVPPPRRVTVPASADATVRTSNLLRTTVPGIIRYAYACLVAIGVLTGLAIETALLNGAHYTLLRPLLFSAAAVAAGVVGGKTWYAAVHRGRKWDGWCIQGFVAGAAVVVAVVAIAGPGLPAGAFLAAATPALLIGMGIGRHGCFWAGCCTGRPTASRWGIWSSDRRLGCRRMPVQLFEAWTALAVGTGALIAVLLDGLNRSGPVAVAGLAAYTLVRQLILGLRDEPRAWRYGRPVTATTAAIALIVSIVLLAV